MNTTSSDPTVAPRQVGRLLARLACATAMAVLAACGGDDDGVTAPTPTPPPTSPQPPPAANAAPVAAFNSAGTAVAGTAVVFDAGGSRDADGDALTYSWSFGNGVRGGGRNIAHVFDTAGSYTVRLTVDDGRGASASVERSVAVSPGPAAAGSVSTLAVVRDARGTPLAEVTVSVIASGTTATTAADGRATLTTDLGVPVALKFSRTGYADQFKRFTLPTAAESGYIEVTMIAREAAQTLPDAAAGGTLAGRDGARIILAPGSLVDAGGNPVSGPVQVSMTPVDVAAEARAFPGRFEGVGPDGNEGLILSYGTVEYILTQNNAPVQLAPGKKATIEIPVYTALNRDGSPVNVGDSYPLWSLNERTGTWVMEGAGTVVAAGSPSDLALRGEVTHFSWWNHDVFDAVPYKPKPRCLVDTNYDGVPENLTGTGYCAHEASPFWENQTAGSSMARAMAEPRTRRIPAFVASTSTPVAGGVELPVPSDMDIVFNSTALNGTLYGRTLLRGGSNVSEDVQIVLSPVQDASGTVAIGVPWNQVYAMSHVGETDRFTLAAQAGQNFTITAGRSNGSTLSGAVSVRNPAGTVVGSASLGSNNAGVTITNATAGTYTVELTATASAPGAYRLQAQAVSGSCASASTLSLPSDAVYPMSGNSVRCFALDLAADAVIDVDLPSRAGLSGVLQLRAPNDEIIARDTFQSGSVRVPLLRLGVAQAGRYQLEIVNTSGATGNAQLRGSFTTGQLISLPQETTVADITTGETRRFVLKQPTAGAAFGTALTACNGNYSSIVYPSRVVTTVNVQFACGTIRGVRAQVHELHPLVLPVIDVTRGSTIATGPAEFTLATLTPTPLALDTDVTVAAPALNRARVYMFDGAAGQEASLGFDRPASVNGAPTLRIVAPDGVEPAAPNAIATLPVSGRYTVEVTNLSSAFSGNFRMRLNNVPAPQPWALTAPLAERTETLVLGQVLRYTFDLAQAEVFTLRLASPTTLDVAAGVGNVSQGSTSTSLSGSRQPQQASSAPSYARISGTRTLLIRSTANVEGSTTGQFTVGVQKPVPAPTALGAEVSDVVTPTLLRSYGYTLPNDGYYLLRWRYQLDGSGNPAGLSGTVWGPSTNFANYTGDLSRSGNETSGGFIVGENVGQLRTGTNTLTAFNSNTDRNIDYAMSLVRLDAPTDLAPGAAATNGNIGVAGERDYYRFSATASQALTVTVNAAFNGNVYVRRLPASGNYTDRFATTIATFPRALAAGVPMVASFTIPSDQAGTYVIEVDATGAETGNYTVQLTTP